MKYQKVLKTQRSLAKIRTVLRPSNYMYLLELYKSFLENFVTFVVFEILSHLVSIPNFLNAYNWWRKQNFENFPT